MAVRDFKPGEIICVQEPYVSNSNTEFIPFAYCCHCLKVSWKSIPCNLDGWSFFCSEKCEKEAWEKYHNIECAVWGYIKNLLALEFWRRLTLRTVIIAIKETGSIEKLRAEVAEIDKCTGEKRIKINL